MPKTRDNPTVSVIIPTYNRAHLVGRAIQSVLNQTYQDFEIIIVDDGSTDNTKEVVKGFGDGRLRYIRLKENSGSSVAPTNAGLRVARGEYIAFLDSDDEWLPEKLGEQLKVFQKDPQVGLVYSDSYIINERENNKLTKVSDTYTFYKGDIYKKLLCAYSKFIPGLTVIVKKECFNRVGLCAPETHAIRDFDLWLRISKEYKVDFVDKPLAKCRLHFSNISLDTINVAKGVKLASDKAFEEDVNGLLSDVKNKVYSNCYVAFAGAFFNQGDFKECRKNLKKAIKIYPKNLFRSNTLILFVLSFLGPKAVKRIRQLKYFIVR